MFEVEFANKQEKGISFFFFFFAPRGAFPPLFLLQKKNEKKEGLCRTAAPIGGAEAMRRKFHARFPSSSFSSSNFSFFLRMKHVFLLLLLYCCSFFSVFVPILVCFSPPPFFSPSPSLFFFFYVLSPFNWAVPYVLVLGIMLQRGRGKECAYVVRRVSSNSHAKNR
ncbi:hypothetical protein, conserved [Trypanosoma brucei gambiense DAL972]|uniref:Uncharacterized protein n=1 Tax=Trypanosoma brucei gambiense (strain MHOM/CI/86/DAL972) TaxID=679716 RepID=C9ZMC5_TRYB9|nr:hypothetical protein, conserved [Trypanosoma brucei gambiense DAL972]CBH10798.1 hypothetical protein, conserved [Trypanosoma brucei gambiense DAL972]|eukprot:XP_011773086.1 hypothetical protein, conserved [Trypanosoma brucei gambiense DAL972]